MFKLAFALVIALVAAAPVKDKQHKKHLAAELDTSTNVNTYTTCPSANNAVCSGNGKCVWDDTPTSAPADVVKGAICTRESANSVTTYSTNPPSSCSCECDEGWEGWDCFVKTKCADDAEVFFDLDHPWFDYKKANGNAQLEYSYQYSDECAITAPANAKSGYPTPTYTKGEMTIGGKKALVKPFTMIAKYTGAITSPPAQKAPKEFMIENCETAWSARGSCGAIVQYYDDSGKLSIKDDDIVIMWNTDNNGYKPSATHYKGVIASHQMKWTNGKCVIFSWQPKTGIKANVGGDYTEIVQAIREIDTTKGRKMWDGTGMCPCSGDCSQTCKQNANMNPRCTN